MGRACSRVGERKCAYREYRVLVGKLEYKRKRARPRPRGNGNIKKRSSKYRMGDVGWIDLAEDKDKWWALVSTVTNTQVPFTRGEFLD